MGHDEQTARRNVARWMLEHGDEMTSNDIPAIAGLLNHDIVWAAMKSLMKERAIVITTTGEDLAAGIVRMRTIDAVALRLVANGEK